MISIKKAKELFLKETSQYDLNNENIKRKQLHSLRVMDNAKQLAEKLNFEKEQIELATLIGLLHDIGRFEQYTKYKTYMDQDSIDHGELGEKLLKQNNRIRAYIEESQYDEIVFAAIRNHGKYQIQDGLKEKELIFAKLIRDADKLDIFYEGSEIFWQKEIEKINQSRVSQEILEQAEKEETVLRTKERRFQQIDSVVELLLLVFDLNYLESFEILKERNLIDKIVNRFQLKDKKSEEALKKIQDKINQYIQNKIENKK